MKPTIIQLGERNDKYRQYWSPPGVLVYDPLFFDSSLVLTGDEVPKLNPILESSLDSTKATLIYTIDGTEVLRLEKHKSRNSVQKEAPPALLVLADSNGLELSLNLHIQSDIESDLPRREVRPTDIYVAHTDSSNRNNDRNLFVEFPEASELADACRTLKAYGAVAELKTSELGRAGPQADMKREEEELNDAMNRLSSAYSTLAAFTDNRLLQPLKQLGNTYATLRRK